MNDLNLNKYVQSGRLLDRIVITSTVTAGINRIKIHNNEFHNSDHFPVVAHLKVEYVTERMPEETGKPSLVWDKASD